MLKEFQKFAMRGNVVDMAVGIIIGGAFGTIVKSLVNDVLMPPIGLLLGGVDFSNLFLTLKGDAQPTLEASKAAGNVTINLGLFLNSVISFLIVAFALFLVIKAINEARSRLDKKEEEEKEAAPPEPSRADIVDLLKQIRDALANPT